MGTFLGKHSCKIDAKSRVSLPSEFRNLLPEHDSRDFCMFPSPRTESIEACDSQYIERISDGIGEQYGIFSKEAEGLSRLLHRTRKVNLDSTGRFILPDEFVSRVVGLEGTVLFVGIGIRFQLWSPEAYDAYDSDLGPLSEDVLSNFRPKPLSNGGRDE